MLDDADMAKHYYDALRLATNQPEVEEVAHRMVDAIRRLNAVIAKQQEVIDGLVSERDESRYRADVALDVAADLVLRITEATGGVGVGSEEEGAHEHRFVDGTCECGESIFIGQESDEEPPAVNDDDDAPKYDDPPTPTTDDNSAPVPGVCSRAGCTIPVAHVHRD
jgi:hypothetical protein